MKSYNLINLYPSGMFATCYRLVLSEKVYIWIDLDEDYVAVSTLSPGDIPVLKNPIFNP